MNVEMSISSSDTDSKCLKVTKALVRFRIDARVTPTVSSCAGRLENGCIVRMGGVNGRDDVKRAWRAVRCAGEYKCAHLDIAGGFSGCVLNYLCNQNMCPAAVSPKAKAKANAKATANYRDDSDMAFAFLY
jgi:hypothetical protein